MDRIRLVMSTFPNVEQARQIGALALENQAIACVNLIPSVESIYRWEGKVESAVEVLAIFKTTESAYSSFAIWLAAVHPYDTPEIVAVDPADVDARYREWILASVADHAR